MRALVTGASGFVGARLVELLERRGVEAWRLSRSAAGEGAIAADISNDALELPSIVFDEVYHAAGLAHMAPRNEAERERFFAVNRRGTERLLTALDALPQPPQRFVLVSTVAVYGREAGENLDEATPREAADPYGQSKRQAEDAAVEWAERRGVRWSVVRLPLVVGPGAPGNLAAMLQALRRNLYFGVGRGDARRSMVALDDAAAALPRLAAVGGAFHLTDGRHPSFFEIEQKLAAALGRRPPRRLPLGAARLLAGAGSLVETATGRRAPFTRRALQKMTSTLTFSDAKARRELGWQPSSVAERLPELLP